jgi:hypothetical protein
MSSLSDPLRAELERWRTEAQTAHKGRVRAVVELEALRTQVLRLRAAGGALAALVADLSQGESDPALGRIVDEALEQWATAEVAVTEDPDLSDVDDGHTADGL